MSYGDNNTNTGYGDSTNTNIRDQTSQFSSGYGDSTNTNIRDRNTGYDNSDSYGDSTGTNIRDQSSTQDYDPSSYSAGDINRRVADAPQQSRATDYSNEPPSHTGGGLGIEDNATTSAAATGGANTSGRDEYGMGTGRSYEQEVGGVGGRPEHFSESKFQDGDDNDSYGSSDRSSDKQDSTKGKLMEQVGGALGSDSMQRKGAEARREAGAYDNNY